MEFMNSKASDHKECIGKSEEYILGFQAAIDAVFDIFVENYTDN
jgi:hypothetical protein